MILDRDQTKALYRRLAPIYDLALWGYRLLGVSRHRRQAVRALHLRPGDAVVDMGCGTGLNFPYLREAVGSEGRIVGVDLSGAMLEKARARAERHGWQNVELIEADLTEYALPENLDGALATFALEMVPEYDVVIRRVAGALPAGKRLALFGLKHPERWPDWLVRLGLWLDKPFGVSREYEAFRPWESVRQYMAEVGHQEFYAGAAYLSVGEVQSRDERNS
jgi:demethylmenaquinone methyltransferase/2-methoxy-6-polyprenyl-1,4-benzoquinol methylase